MFLEHQLSQLSASELSELSRLPDDDHDELVNSLAQEFAVTLHNRDETPPASRIPVMTSRDDFRSAVG